MNFDDTLNLFRIASRELFNSYFRVADPYSNWDRAWLLAERFNEIEDVLFEKMVLEESGLKEAVYRQPQTEIWVQPRSDTTPILINREIESGYWDHPVYEVDRTARLLFLSFFDWDSIAFRDNQYVRIIISDWQAHPETLGKHSLIEARNVEFVLARLAQT